MGRRAFVGLAGPFGYDYRNSAPRVNDNDHSSPNPVLENVLGLLLCYEQIIFLAPQFCPADMRNLPYVKFVSDDEAMLRAAIAALDEFDSSKHENWPAGADLKYPDFKDFSKISAEMVAGRDVFAIDNHTHGVHLSADRVVTGNAMNLENVVRDLWINSELELRNVDVIVSTPAQKALNGVLEKELAEAYSTEHVRRTAAQHLAALCVPNFLDVSGSYHELLEELRDRRDAVEFRQYLAELDVDTEDGTALATTISRQAFEFVDEQSRRFLKGKSWFESIAIPGVRGVLNAFHRPVGSVVATVLQAPLTLGEREFKSRSRWAPFVVNMHRPR